MKYMFVWLTALTLYSSIFAQQDSTGMIDLASIDPIAIAQPDWQQTKQSGFEADPLAAYVPADQHAFFYPTFRRMMDFVDALKSGRQSLEPLGFSVSQFEFYEQQMCVWLDGWSRFWGPKTIRGVVLTGSDTYMAEGTDSAILFDASIGKLVFNNTRSKQEKKLKDMPDAKLAEGSVGGIAYRAVVSPDRKVCSYLAQIDNVVVVTNSLVQLQKIIDTAQRKSPCMRDTNEYRFLRSRYNIDDNEQTALVVLTEAAIERWLSPKWYIGRSRRRLAAQAGAASSTYGTWLFMTPIAELAIDQVTALEQQQYGRFRQSFQQRWQKLVGPAGICFLHEAENTNIALTLWSDSAAGKLNNYIAANDENAVNALNASLAKDCILQAAIAVDGRSQWIRELNARLSDRIPSIPADNAFEWLGRRLIVDVFDGEFWNACRQSAKTPAGLWEFAAQNMDRLPIAFATEVSDQAMLDAFLAALGGHDQTAPIGASARTDKGAAYEKMTLPIEPNNPPLTIYYARTSRQLAASPVESVLRKAIDTAPSAKRQKSIARRGETVSLIITERGWSVLEPLFFEPYAAWLTEQPWYTMHGSVARENIPRPLFRINHAEMGITVNPTDMEARLRFDYGKRR
ncbi:MAG: hypothetical protein LLF76_12095 [Planctomycetaceae bacterium]|nr:hypothetical protein [Planctomycetaceae bacterium]